MIKLSECTRQNLCVDCDSTDCLHARSLIADCPKYHCDRPSDQIEDCESCAFLRDYQEKMIMDRITYDCKLMYGDDYPDFEAQYSHCPLVEIPTPHGNLKDESDIISLIEAMFCEDKDGMECAIQCVKDVDTVIKAEGSEE